MLEQLGALKKEHAELETELAAYGACDPAKVEEKKRAVVLAREAAVRWTGECLCMGSAFKSLMEGAWADNYIMLLSHFTRQNCVEAADIRAYLGVDEEYEDIEG